MGYDPDSEGGTGCQWNYDLIAGRSFRAPVIVAGGLNPQSVGAVITGTNPWGVDTASGVERDPGIKDEAAMCAFVDACRP